MRFIGGTENPRELCVACAREAYQSHGLSTPESDAKLLRSLVKQGHRAITEFARMTFELNYDEYRDMIDLLSAAHGWVLTRDKNYWLTLNPRTLIDGLLDKNSHGMAETILAHVPDEFHDLIFNKDELPVLKTIQYPREEPCSVWNVYDTGQAKHSFKVVRFVSTRGLMDELFRHRLGAMVGSSTRRVDYSELKIDFPDEHWHIGQEFIETTEYTYRELRETHGLDVARNVLPLGMKVSYVYGTSLCHWEYIKSLRLSKHAHPEFKEVLAGV